MRKQIELLKHHADPPAQCQQRVGAGPLAFIRPQSDAVDADLAAVETTPAR